MRRPEPAVSRRLGDLSRRGAPEDDGGAHVVPRAPSDAQDGGLRARALTAAMSTYTAAHGHPLGPEHAVGGVQPGDRRWLPSRRVVVSAAVALLLVLVVVLVGRLGLPAGAPTVVVPGGAGAADVLPGSRGEGRPGEGPGSAGGPAGDATTEPAAGGTGTEPPSAGRTPGAPPVVVHVVGEVAAPGLVELPTGARVADAIEAAGGATPAAVLAGVNLARPVVDGEQVLVPAEGAAPASSTPTGPAGTPGGVLDLNTADAAALDGLPGVGPVLAERIVAWREDHGRFGSVDELVEVSGIGPALLADVRDLVRVG